VTRVIEIGLHAWLMKIKVKEWRFEEKGVGVAREGRENKENLW